MISGEIRRRIEKRLGQKIRYSKDCEILAQSIRKTCKQTIGATTLKRMFGFATSNVMPRQYTLDVLAIYIGFPDWKTANAEMDFLPKIDINDDSEIHMLNHEICRTLSTNSINTENVIHLCQKFSGKSELIFFLAELVTIAAKQKNTLFL